MRTVLMVVGIVLGSGAAAAAQTPSSPLTAAAKRQFEQVHGLVMRAADKVDEDISCLYGCFRRPLWVVYTGAAPAVSP